MLEQAAKYRTRMRKARSVELTGPLDRKVSNAEALLATAMKGSEPKAMATCRGRKAAGRSDSRLWLAPRQCRTDSI